MNIKKIVLLSSMLVMTSCGIEVSTHSTSYDPDYLAVDLTYIDEYGDHQFLKQECIDLDGASESEEINIHNENALHELKIRWIRRGDHFKLRVYEGHNQVYSTFYSTEMFRNGQNSDFRIDVDNVSYKVKLSGPFCN